jgi:hypothetical protein
MTLKEILNTLVEIEGHLDDAYYSLPEWEGVSDGKSYIDSARNDVYNLKDEIERTLLDEDKVISGKELEEVMNTPVVNPL